MPVTFDGQEPLSLDKVSGWMFPQVNPVINDMVYRGCVFIPLGLQELMAVLPYFDLGYFSCGRDFSWLSFRSPCQLRFR